MNRRRTLLIGSALLFALAGAGGAEEPAVAEASIPEQLDRLNATMEQIVELLRRQVEGQETVLLIQRVDLSGRTLITKKGRLRKARAEAAELADEEISLTNILEAVEQEQAEGAESDPYSQLQRVQMEERLESLEGRRRDLAREILLLEGEVSREEENLEVIEAVLDERLGLR